MFRQTGGSAHAGRFECLLLDVPCGCSRIFLTRLTPEQYVAGLTDFGPGRSRLFGTTADEYLMVHHRGRSEADVTEGSGDI